MKVLIVLLMIPFYGIGQYTGVEQIFYNQADFFASKKVNQIVIQGNNRFIFTLHENGHFKELIEHCSDSTVLAKSEFNNEGIKIYSASYDYECTGKLKSETHFIYEGLLLTETRHKYQNESYTTTTETLYDSLNRKVKHITRGGPKNSISYWDEYSYPNDSTMINLRVDQDSSLIYTGYSELNDSSQIIRTTYFRDGFQSARYDFDYTEKGILTKEIGFYYPSREMITRRTYYYDRKDRLIKLDAGTINKKNYVVYKYDDDGFLIQSIKYDGDSISHTNYEYQKSSTRVD